jgi:hypothetical protein
MDFWPPSSGFLDRTHIQTHGRTPLVEWSARRRNLYLHRTTQQTNIHAPRGIRTRNPSNQAAADLRLRPRCHWDRRGHPSYAYNKLYFNILPELGNRTILHGITTSLFYAEIWFIYSSNLVTCYREVLKSILNMLTVFNFLLVWIITVNSEALV